MYCVFGVSLLYIFMVHSIGPRQDLGSLALGSCINNLQEPDSSPRSLNGLDRGRIISSSPQIENQAEDEELSCQKSCIAGVTTQIPQSQPSALKQEIRGNGWVYLYKAEVWRLKWAFGQLRLWARRPTECEWGQNVRDAGAVRFYWPVGKKRSPNIINGSVIVECCLSKDRRTLTTLWNPCCTGHSKLFHERPIATRHETCCT